MDIAIVEKNKLYDRAYSRRYRKEHPTWKKVDNLKRQPKTNIAIKKNGEKNQDRLYAREQLRYAVKSGKILRGKCVLKKRKDCGAGIIEGHHTDYFKPLSVVWMCHSHHKQFHAGLVKVAGKYIEKS